MPVYSLGDYHPDITESVFIAPSADIIGRVEIGDRSSVWFGCVLRGDGERIKIGQGSNIQDRTIVHISTGRLPAVIGNNVTVGHSCTIHAATLADHAFVGMGAIVMDGALVGSFAMVAAGAVVPPGMEVPDGMLAAGLPARIVRPVRDSERQMIKDTAELYQSNARWYQELRSNDG